MLSLPQYAFTAVSTLISHGYKAYPVGGCVRDALLRIPPHDCDVTTSALPEEILSVFAEYNCVKNGIAHGTVTVVIDGVPVEITTFRTDGTYTDCRHPDSVKFTSSLREDLSRRDFTVNAMAYDFSTEKVIDCFGGLQDLEQGVIRCVGNPDIRFQEDALRIVRALRFASVLGFSIGESTEWSLFKSKSLLQNVSAERLRDELVKLLCGKDAGDIVISYADMISEIIPEITEYTADTLLEFKHAAAYLNEHREMKEPKSSKIIRLALLFKNLSGNTVHSILRRLRFDNRTTAIVTVLVSEARGNIEASEISVKLCLNRLSTVRVMSEQELFRVIIQMRRACSNNSLAAELERIYKKITDECQCYKLSDMMINGEDLANIGYSGKAIGSMLSLLLSKVICGELENNREVLLDYASKAKILS